MSIRNQIGVALVFAAGTFCAAQIASADHHAKSGTFEVITSGIADLKTVEFFDYSATAGSAEGTSTIVASTGGPFIVGESSIYSGVIYAKKSAAGIDLEGPGVTTDSSGDKWFWVARRKAGDQETGGGGAGRQEIVGGTGKYEGITGSCEYKIDYLAGNRIIAQTSCEWEGN